MLKRAFAAIVALTGCADPSGPATHLHAEGILVAGTEEGALLVDLDWRGIIRRSGPRFVGQGPNVLNGRGELITVGRLADGATVMAGLNIESGLELWRTAISQGTTPVTMDGVALGATMITSNPSRPEVFLWRAVQSGVTGIAGYDYSKRRITRFIGPVGTRFRAMAGTPATTQNPDGCLVMAMDAGTGANTRAFLHVVCGTSYADRDSMSLALPSRQVLQMELTAEGRDLIVMTDIELLKLDPATLSVKVRATRPLAAPFFAARSTGTLIIPDVGSSFVASTGIIYLLGADLELSSIIDLRALSFGERPLGILGAEESLDRKWLYIVGGVPRNGPLYGPQQTHVVIIDKSTGLVVDTVHLHTVGGGRAILVP